MKIQYRDSNCKINNVGVTSEKITGRGGLTFMLRYLESVGLFDLFERSFGKKRKSKKGTAISSILRQLISFMVDGTNPSISYFDKLNKDDGYAAALELKTEKLQSSHSIKRFFRKFRNLSESILFQKVLNKLFVWRLHVEQPKRIVLDIDTMVMDNGESNVREGVKPTYKKGVKGFQNLQITWNGRIVDAMFRNGSSHSNHKNDVKKSLKRVVDLIRKEYQADVEIIVTLDSGFFDEENFHYLDKVLKVYFVCTGKMYSNLKSYLSKVPEDSFKEFSNKKSLWHYFDFGNKRTSWTKVGFFRTIYTKFITDKDGQVMMDFIRPNTIQYTNMGCSSFDKDANDVKIFSAEEIIKLSHGRGSSELVNRSFKEFIVKESLPFKNFAMNASYYYMQAISHACFIAFKIDNLDVVEGVNAEIMPNTFRRIIIDFAAKIVKKGHGFVLKVSCTIYNEVNIKKLWQLINEMPPIKISEHYYSY